MGYTTLSSPVWGKFVIPRLIILAKAYLSTKFEDYGFTHSKGTKDDQNILKWSDLV